MGMLHVPEGKTFRSQERLEVSWALAVGWLPYQRLELENNFVGAHVLGSGTIPAAQFWG